MFTGSSNTKPSDVTLRNISQNMYSAIAGRSIAPAQAAPGCIAMCPSEWAILSVRPPNGAEPSAGSAWTLWRIAKITAVGTQASGPHNAEDTGVSLIPRRPTRCLAPLIEWIIRASNPPYPPGCLGGIQLRHSTWTDRLGTPITSPGLTTVTPWAEISGAAVSMTFDHSAP